VKMLEDVLAGVKECDAVLHFAGYKSVGESMQKPDMYWDNNVGGFVNLMHLLEKYQVSNRVLLSSSCTVYKPSSEKISEDSELQPTCPYGDTKFLACKSLQVFLIQFQPWLEIVQMHPVYSALCFGTSLRCLIQVTSTAAGALGQKLTHFTLVAELLYEAPAVPFEVPRC